MPGGPLPTRSGLVGAVEPGNLLVIRLLRVIWILHPRCSLPDASEDSRRGAMLDIQDGAFPESALATGRRRGIEHAPAAARCDVLKAIGSAKCSLVELEVLIPGQKVTPRMKANHHECRRSSLIVWPRRQKLSLAEGPGIASLRARRFNYDRSAIFEAGPVVGGVFLRVEDGGSRVD